MRNGASFVPEAFVPEALRAQSSPAKKRSASRIPRITESPSKNPLMMCLVALLTSAWTWTRRQNAPRAR